MPEMTQMLFAESPQGLKPRSFWALFRHGSFDSPQDK